MRTRNTWTRCIITRSRRGCTNSRRYSPNARSASLSRSCRLSQVSREGYGSLSWQSGVSSASGSCRRENWNKEELAADFTDGSDGEKTKAGISDPGYSGLGAWDKRLYSFQRLLRRDGRPRTEDGSQLLPLANFWKRGSALM